MRGYGRGQRPRQGLVYEVDVMLEGHPADAHTKRMADALGESASLLEPAKRDRRANRASASSRSRSLPRERTVGHRAERPDHRLAVTLALDRRGAPRE